MKSSDLKSMSVDQLWELHEHLLAELGRKIAEEQARLEERLRRLGSANGVGKLKGERRFYPKVLPKYRNPKDPHETWAGRGKQPRWLRAQLRAGKKLNDFLIQQLSA